MPANGFWGLFARDPVLRSPAALACDQVEEGEALEVLGLLVAVLHDLVVSLPQRLHAQPMPCLLLVQLLIRQPAKSR